MGKQFPSRDELHDDMQVTGVLEKPELLNYKGRGDPGENGDFIFDMVHLFLLHQVGLGEGFECPKFPLLISDEVDHSEGPLAEHS